MTDSRRRGYLQFWKIFIFREFKDFREFRDFRGGSEYSRFRNGELETIVGTAKDCSEVHCVAGADAGAVEPLLIGDKLIVAL